MISTQEFDYAIIGGGAAGTLLAIRLLQAAPSGARIAMIEVGKPGRGVAYGSDNPAHVLNVPAGGMSLFAERPNDFVDFLIARDGQADAAAFVPRRDYAAYLSQRLDEARIASAAAFVHVRAHARDVQPGKEGVEITLEPDGRIFARRLALAPGNRARRCPFDADGARRVLSAWDHVSLEQIDVDDDVVIVGSGLSMVDVVLGLQARGHRGLTTVVSRHGLLPLAHAPKKQAVGIDIDAFADLGLRARVQVLREQARQMSVDGLPWQSLMDALRHHVRELWQSLSPADQRRFLRHVVRYWDVHRHRIPGEVAAQLRSLTDSGALALLAGRVRRARDADDSIDISIEKRHGDTSVLHARWLVNATGIETRAAHFPNPLLRAMLARGHLRPGPHGLGIDTDIDAVVINRAGEAQPCIAAIGSLRLGNLWETTAVPDLRADAALLAKKWLESDRQDG